MVVPPGYGPDKEVTNAFRLMGETQPSFIVKMDLRLNVSSPMPFG